MKRLTLLLLGLALGVCATANAQGLTMQMSNGWSFTFAGNVNAFYVYSKVNNNGPGNSNIRTGLLPAFATFEAKGKEGGLTLGVHIGFAPQINTADQLHDVFGNAAGAQIDMRQVYLTVGFKDGSSLLVGRELGLFGRQNILQDMTLFGVGAVGIGNSQGGGTTLGRIGYGYIYPNFNAQVTYNTKPGEAQLSVGAFQPSVLGSGTYTFTKVPRLEAEVTYNHASGKSKWLVWAGGLWQTTSNAATGGNSASSVGGTAGIKGSMSDLTVVVTGYIGKGLGTVLMFSGGEIAANGTSTRPSDGGYVQVMYKVDPKWDVGASWGFSRLKHDQTGDGNTAVIVNWASYTLGIYHQWTKSLKWVAEGTREQNGNGTGAPAQVDISTGLMLFF
jgi:hypothetical protein